MVSSQADVEAARAASRNRPGMTIFTRSRLPSIDGGRFDRLVHAFERRPRRRRSATSPSRRGRSRRSPARPAGLRIGIITSTKWIFGLVRGGRGFRGVVVAHQREHAAVLARCRRNWRGGTRRRCGRRPGPCRTRCRTRRRILPSPRSSACCEPHTAVAARSSLMPGWKTMSLRRRSASPRAGTAGRGRRAASRDSR